MIPNPPPGWCKVSKEKLWPLEMILRYFKGEIVRTALAETSKHFSDKKSADRQERIVLAELVYVVMIAFEETAFKNPSQCNTATIKTDLVKAAKNVFAKHKVLSVLADATPPPGCEWIKFTTDTAQAATPADAAETEEPLKKRGRPTTKVKGSEVPEELKGKLQTLPDNYDEKALVELVDLPKTKPSPVQSAGKLPPIPVPWQEWRFSDLYYKSGLPQSLDSTVSIALHLVHVQFDPSNLPIDIEVFSPDGKRPRVVATKDIDKGELHIPMTTCRPARLMASTSHPLALKVGVEHKLYRLKPNDTSCCNVPTAPAEGSEVNGNKPDSATQPSAPAAANTANSVQTEQVAKPNDGSTDTQTGCSSSPDASPNVATVYKQGDVFKAKAGGRQWTVHKVSETTVGLTALKINAKGKTLTKYEEITLKFQDLEDNYERHKTTAKADVQTLQAPAPISSPPAGGGLQTNTTTTVEVTDEVHHVHVIPDFCLPEWVPTDKAQVGHVQTDQWKITAETALNPFWAVRRITPSVLSSENVDLTKKCQPTKSFNCELSPLRINVMSGTSIDKQVLSDARCCTLWEITNSQNIIRGTELLIAMPETTTQSTGRSANKRQKTTHSAPAA